MKSIKYIELSNELVKKIISYFPTKKYLTQSHLFYEGQVPISGYLLLNGCIKVTQKKKLHKILNPGHVLGVNELLTTKPISLSAEAFPNTEICFMDKTTLNEIFQNPEPELALLINFLMDRKI